MGLKPEKWAALKAAQRAGKRRLPFDQGTLIDAQRQRRGMQPRFTDITRSRKQARRARVKGK